MAKKLNETAIKGRQTKLEKKSYDELVQIILKKDKIERNLNNQIKSLKGEVNALSTRVKNFDSDMQGTMQTLESYKDQVATLQEKNDTISIESKDNYNLYINENQKTVSLERKLETWKTVACIMLVVIIIGVIIVTF